MHDPLDDKNRTRFERLQRMRWFTGLVLWIESISRGLWQAFFWTLAFCGLWMLGAPGLIGPAASALLFLLFVAGLAYWLVQGRHALKPPSPQEIDRRLQAGSGLAHRPLDLLEDAPANPQKKETAALWQMGRDRALETLNKLKPPAPRPFIAALDRYALRAVAVLLFLSGLAVAGPGGGLERIGQGLSAPFSLLPELPGNPILATITPPDYTGQGQILLEGPGFSAEALKIPAGSVLKISVRSRFGGLSLKLNEEAIPLGKLDDRNYAAEAVIRAGGRFTVRQFLIPRMSAPLEAIPDEPPRIALQQPEDSEKDAKTHYIMPEGAMRFPLSVYDDYGVKDIAMRMDLAPEAGEAPLGYPVEETRSLTSPAGKDYKLEPVYDFTSSPWAGLPATVTFTVSDHIGQTAQLGPLAIVLPERDFRHPVAKTLIALRKKLAWEPTAPPDSIVAALEGILEAPGSFQHDIVAALAMRAASARLYHTARGTAGLTRQDAWEVMALLWDTALRVEDGNLSLAARNLREAQRNLENALKGGKASEEELAQLADEVRAYLQEYLAELQRELQKRMENGEQFSMVPPELLSRTLDSNMFDQFLQQMIQEMMQGNTDKAQDMLSQLRRMLDAMNPSLAMPMPQDMQMMQEGINEMQELIDRQEELLSQTEMQAESLLQQTLQLEKYKNIFRFNPQVFKRLESQDIPLPPVFEELKELSETKVDTSGHRVEQEALRFVLGQLMIEAGEYFETIPENLGLAELEMRESSGRLGENRPDLSVPRQEKTLEHLKEAQKQMQQQMMERLQQMVGSSGMALFMSPGMRPDQTDPLGRPFSHDPDAPDHAPLYAPIEIPDEAKRRRIQDIMKLLRERSGELDRPEEELEYFRRLLRQF